MSTLACIFQRAQSWARAFASTNHVAKLAGLGGLLVLAGAAALPAQARADETQAPDLRQLDVDRGGIWSGDFDGMLQRG
jgi:hypothetical protein